MIFVNKIINHEETAQIAATEVDPKRHLAQINRMFKAIHPSISSFQRGIWPKYLVDPERHLARVSSRSREAFGPSILSIQEAFGPSIQSIQKGIWPEYLVDPKGHLARISSRSRRAFGPSI